jgi:branched-chain amino acid transport system substrate-binding protein
MTAIGLAAGGGIGYAIRDQWGPPGGTSGTGQQGATRPWRLGVPYFQTGPFTADGKEVIESVTLAVEEINAEGGVLGQPIEIFTSDLANGTPEEVRPAVNKLVDIDKVDGITMGWGLYRTGWEIVTEANVPTLCVDSPPDMPDFIKENDASVYMNTAAVPFNGISAWEVFDHLLNTGFKPEYGGKIFTITSSFYWEVAYADSVAAEAQKRGWEVVGREVIASGTSDWGSLLAKIRSDPPDIITNHYLGYSDNARLVRQFYASPPGNSLFWLSFTPGTGEYRRLMGTDDDGIIWGSDAYVLPPDGQNYINRYRTRWDKDPGITAHTTYQNVPMMAMAWKLAGSTDKEKINEALLSIAPTVTTGRFVWHQQDHQPLEGPALVPFVGMQRQNGKDVILYPEGIPRKGIEPYYGQYQDPPYFK